MTDSHTKSHAESISVNTAGDLADGDRTTGPRPTASSIVRIGPAGWSYPDWSGYVYPSRRPKGFHEATYLAQFFDTIEINTSFYAPIRPEHAAQWMDHVSANPRFLFTAKLWQRFTHDIVPSAPPSREDEKQVRAGFDVLRDKN